VSYDNPPPPPPPQYGAPPPPGQPMGSPPPNNLVWAILVTLFCCLPFGIVSIVYAAQVNGKWQAGDAAGAQESSRKARQWAIYGAIAGVVIAVIYLIVAIAASNS
jgi:hypothetical protein